MRFTTELSPDDYRDFLESFAGEGVEEAKAREVSQDLSKTSSRMPFMMAIFFGALAWFLYRWGLDGLLDRPFVLILALIGFLCVPVAIQWMMNARRVRADLKDVANGQTVDQNALRNGLNIAEGNFDLDQDGVTISLALVQSSYSWTAFRELKETSSAFLLMIDDGSGLILPKRAFGDDLRRQEFQALVAKQIGAGG